MITDLSDHPVRYETLLIVTNVWYHDEATTSQRRPIAQHIAVVRVQTLDFEAPAHEHERTSINSCRAAECVNASPLRHNLHSLFSNLTGIWATSILSRTWCLIPYWWMAEIATDAGERWLTYRTAFYKCKPTFWGQSYWNLNLIMLIFAVVKKEVVGTIFNFPVPPLGWCCELCLLCVSSASSDSVGDDRRRTKMLPV